MKRLITSTCLAATFAVGLAAQSTDQPPRADRNPQGQRRGGARGRSSGCLRAGDTAGTYMLTDVQMQGGGRRGGDTTGYDGAGTTGSDHRRHDPAAARRRRTSGEQGRGNMPTTLMLNPADSSVNLKAHVGHRDRSDRDDGGPRRPGRRDDGRHDRGRHDDRRDEHQRNDGERHQHGHVGVRRRHAGWRPRPQRHRDVGADDLGKLQLEREIGGRRSEVEEKTPASNARGWRRSVRGNNHETNLQPPTSNLRSP